MAQLLRANAFQEDSQEIRVPLGDLRNADGTLFPATTPGSGQYALISGGWGTGGTKLNGEAASGNTKTSTAKLTFAVPQNYVAGTNMTLKITARVSAVANTTANIDAACFKSNEQGGVSGSDLVTTTVITHNSVTWTEHSFTITSSAISPGDELDIYIRHSVDDSGGATGAKAEIGGVLVSMSTKM